MNFSACPAGGGSRRWKKRWRAVWPLGLFALGATMIGCQSASPPPASSARGYRPDNIFMYPPRLSPDLQRVAVLPIAAESTAHDLPEGCATLTPVLWEQLVKTKRFEVVAVDPGLLHSSTGQQTWTGGETLPAGFLAVLRREYGCDAILFSELTTYRAYAPLAVGWRLKLVDARSGQVLWAADEVFDAAKPAIAHAVQRFTEPGLALPFLREQNWMAINSPSQFGRYSAATLLDTLPDR